MCTKLYIMRWKKWIDCWKNSCVDVVLELWMDSYESILVYSITSLYLWFESNCHMFWRLCIMKSNKEMFGFYSRQKCFIWGNFDTKYPLNWFHETSIQIGFRWCDEPIAIQIAHYEIFIIVIHPNLSNRCSHIVWLPGEHMLFIYISWIKYSI